MTKNLTLSALALLAAATTAFAAPPDAGQLIREQQPQRQLPQQLPSLDTEKERAPLADSGIRITVKAIRFTGYEGLAAENDLQALVADAIGKSLTFSELQGLAAKTTTYLKEKGWFLARAYLPKQDVTAGTIEIAIIQGKSDGSLTINRDKSARISDDRVRAIAGQAVSPGQPLSEQQLERAALLLNDLPGVTAKANLVKGDAAGSTAVQFDVSEGPLLSGAIWGDNQGNRYTGAWRGNGMLNVNDPFRYGDQLSLLMTGSEGFILGRVAYSFPIGTSGLKGNISYSGMNYEIISGDAVSTDPEGYSHTVDGGLSYPILRSRTANVTASIGYEFKNLVDSFYGINTNNRYLHSGNISFTGDKYDTVLGGGMTNWNASVTTGDKHENIDTSGSLTDRTEGKYTRFNLGLSRLQRVAERVSLNLSWSSQFSLDNLDSSEKFNLGGPNGVRAYPVGEATGDEGHLLNADLRYDLPLPASMGTLQASGFYDAGWIRLHKQIWGSITTISGRNEYWLQGAGIGLNYAFGGHFSLKASWAHTIGDNQGRSTTDRDADGRSENDRFWLQAMFFF